MKKRTLQLFISTIMAASIVPYSAQALPRTLYELPFTPTGLNNLDHVVGGKAISAAPGRGAFVFRDGRVEQLELTPDAPAYPTDINDSGTVAGYLGASSSYVNGGLIKWQGTQISSLTQSSPPGLSGSFPYARSINELGEIAGDYQPATTGAPRRGFVINAAGDSSRELLVPDGSPDSGPIAVNELNDSGAVVGATATPIAWDSAGAGRYLTALLFGEARGINALGVMVGTASPAIPRVLPRGVIWNGSETISLGALWSDPFFGFSQAHGVNDRNDVVGSSNTPSDGIHAVLYRSATGLQDLNTLLPAGSAIVLGEAVRINNRATVIGTARNANGSVGYMLKLVASEMRPLGACARRIAAGQPVRRNSFCQFELSIVDSRRQGLANSSFFIQRKRANAASFENIGGGVVNSRGQRVISLRIREAGVYRINGPLTHAVLPGVPSNEMFIRVN